ncbi:MAG: serine/threonine protein kinase [Magnetococcales bacterium]|nr:serine/threonine protein kinase [Magnetococcales bacterium]MBF0439002.1 serine/threonine protein kinase [Magnetococcales bacterium]
MQAMINKTPYKNLSPEVILDAVESVGYRCDGRLLALNSFENRVYQIGLNSGESVVSKFYRNDRWSLDHILEEHEFALELTELEIPVVAPLVSKTGQSLHHWNGFRFAIYPRCGGRAPDLENLDHLQRLGVALGRIHAVGATHPFISRPTLNVETFGVEPYRFLTHSTVIPQELRTQYNTLVHELLVQIRHCFERAEPFQSIRLHGDCHSGNILWSESGPLFVDFDDARMGPAIQDLWMCLSGERDEQELQLSAILKGYLQFYHFNAREIHLIEALRTLRMIHYAAWIARRWDDPAFPRAFPWFDAPRYWDNHILSLREQLTLMNEPPLEWNPHAYMGAY